MMPLSRQSMSKQAKIICANDVPNAFLNWLQ
jgi:hypothetical protein